MKTKWSRKYNKCKKCGTIENPHIQHGYCTKCWGAKVHKKYKSYYKKYYKNYWAENKEKLSKRNKEYYQKNK